MSCVWGGRVVHEQLWSEVFLKLTFSRRSLGPPGMNTQALSPNTVILTCQRSGLPISNTLFPHIRELEVCLVPCALMYQSEDRVC